MAEIDRKKEAEWEAYKNKTFPPRVTGAHEFRLNLGVVRAAYLAGLKQGENK